MNDAVGAINGDRKTEFVAGVAETAGTPLVVIDVSKFDRDLIDRIVSLIEKEVGTAMAATYTGQNLLSGADKHPEKAQIKKDLIQEVKKQFTEQGKALPDGMTDDELAEMAAGGLLDGYGTAKSMRIGGKDTCIATFNYDHSGEIAEEIRDIKFKRIPWSGLDFARYAGRHEGGHCAQDVRSITTTSIQARHVKEIDADSRALQLLRKEGKHEIADAIIDINKISAVIGNDTEHATGFFLTKTGYNAPSSDDIKTLKNLKSDMIAVVAAKQNISVDDALKMLKKNTVEFAKIVKDTVKEGALQQAPNARMADYMNQFADAVERRVEPASPTVAKPVAKAPIENFVSNSIIMPNFSPEELAGLLKGKTSGDNSYSPRGDVEQLQAQTASAGKSAGNNTYLS